MVAHACHPSYAGGPNPGEKPQDPVSKLTTAKRAGRVAQVVEYLPSKCKALSSHPSAKEEEEEGEEEVEEEEDRSWWQ
jgi:hypothetical protein